MLLLQNTFTNDPKQQAEIQLPNNTTFLINLQYTSLTFGWYADIIYSTANFKLMGVKITNNLNILDSFRQILNFGLAFIIEDGGEAWYLDDFSGGRIQVYLLDSSDISNLSNIYNNIL